jgi:copper resistance protein C
MYRRVGSFQGKRRLSAVLVAEVVAVLPAYPAFAHAILVRSDPPAGSVVRTEPKVLTLTFTEGLEIPFCAVTVNGTKDTRNEAGRLRGVPGHSNEIVVPPKAPISGAVTVTWHATSVDTHKSEGQFTFTVKQ